MRRGSRLLIIVGILIAAAAAALLFFYLQTLNPTNPNTGVGPDGAPLVQPVATEDPGINVVVAAVNIPEGIVITDTELLSLENIPSSEYNARPGQYLNSVNEALQKLTVSQINAGERLTKTNLTDPGLSQQIEPVEPGRARDKAIALQVDALTAVADQAKVNDFVDIVATFTIQRRISLPPVIPPPAADGTILPPVRSFELVDFVTTKTLIQRSQVLRIVRPPPPPDQPQPAPQAAQPTVVVLDASGQPVAPVQAPQQVTNITGGQWILVLAMNDQESEILDFARNSNAKITVVLRGGGDTDFEPTLGASLDLLVSEFGMPLPEPILPFGYGNEILTPNPIRTPAPTRVP